MIGKATHSTELHLNLHRLKVHTFHQTYCRYKVIYLSSSSRAHYLGRMNGRYCLWGINKNQLTLLPNSKTIFRWR